jgi:hypothetical protein
MSPFTRRHRPLWLQNLLWLLYALWSGFNTWHHEVWRDEVHSWAIAKASTSWIDVIDRSAFEGHPSLWYFIMYGLQHFSTDINSLQVVHWLLAVAAVGILIRYAPFPLWQKTLLICGYFFVYEYSAIARNYAIELLLLFAFCALYPRRFQKKVLIILLVLLFLMMDTNAFALMLGIALGGLLFWEVALHYQWRSGMTWLVLASWLGSSVLAAWDTQPAQGATSASQWKTTISSEQIAEAGATVWDGLVPIPKQELHFWNTNFVSPPIERRYRKLIGSADIAFIERNNMPLKAAAASLLFLLAIAMLWRHPRVLLCFISGFLLLFLLIYVKYHGSLRHHGHFWILWITALWLANANTVVIARWKKRVQYFFFTLVLLLHICGAYIATCWEYGHEFSPDEAAAAFLTRQPGFADAPWICDFDYIAEGVTGVIDKKIFFTTSKNWGTYVVWNEQRGSCDSGCMYEYTTHLRDSTQRDVWMLMHYEVRDTNLLRLPGFESYGFWGEHTVENLDRFFIYRLKHQSL